MASIAVWLGIATITSLLITIVLGVLMRKGKRVFKHHRYFAYLTGLLALIHAIVVITRIY